MTRPSDTRSFPGVHCHRSRLPADEIATVSGIAVTGVSRTLLDLAPVLTVPRLERALNEAEVLSLTDALSIPDLLERYPRRRGTAVLRAALKDESTARGITRSEMEDRFLALLEGTDLPRPRLNADVAVGGRFLEADCVWLQQRLIVELDGRRVHGTARAISRRIGSATDSCWPQGGGWLASPGASCATMRRPCSRICVGFCALEPGLLPCSHEP